MLGNGTWLNVGGNQAVEWGGEPASAQDGSVGPYFNADGRTSYVFTSGILVHDADRMPSYCSIRLVAQRPL